MRTLRLFAFGFIAAMNIGCAAHKAVVTDTTLGSVIVYRNGVAYFERYAEPGDDAIELKVPADRVDDFLKSLSIVDVKTGEAVPVSYPTQAFYEGFVTMAIPLPQNHARLRITYVTEAPAWKPSYRVVLQEGDKARLQGWAVVDNASGEDWKRVKVGVGSTSALSFRYDLHSVRLVERETLSSGERLAAAPPSGGSPYAVAKRKVRVLGDIDASELAQLDGRLLKPPSEEIRAQNEPAPTSVASERDEDTGQKASKKHNRGFFDRRALEQLKAQAGAHRIRIEGYAQRGDGDPVADSTRRANQVRDQLLNMGIPASNIEAVGTGRISRQAVRVLAAEEAHAARGEKSSLPPRETQPVGKALFVSDDAMDLEKDHSAMVSTLNEVTDAKRVYFYDPVSQRGSRRYAFNAVRVRNPSRYTLDGGPFTIYAGGRFLGEGLSEPILPHSTAFIPYALDKSIVADPEVNTRDEIDKLVTIQRGILSTETRKVRTTTLTVSNRGKQAAEVYVRHKVQDGFSLTASSEKRRAAVTKLGGAHLFRVAVAAGEAVELVIEEWSPMHKTVDIRTDRGVRDIGLFLRKKRVSPALRSKLEAVLQAHRKRSNLEEKIQLAHEQLGVYRARVDELNFQLLSLKKVRQAEKLRRHLTQKMESISDALQKLTLQIAEQKGELMALRIDLQNKLADLSLKPAAEGKVAASN
ncbi:MAG: DUF4139 domain-containing protein [Myxococcota bacterium]